MGKLALVLGCAAAASPNALCGSGFFVTTAGIATAPALMAAALYFLIVAPQVSALFESSDFRPRLAKLSVALSAALILIEYGALVALAVGRREGVYALFGFEQVLHFAALAMALAAAGPFEAWAGPSAIRWGSFALGALSLACSIAMSAMAPNDLLGPWAVAAFGVCAAVVLSISYYVTADGARCTGVFFCGSLLMSAIQRFINWRCISIFEMPAWAAISLCLVTVAGAVALFVLARRQAAIQEGPISACGDERPSAEDPASVVREALLGLRGGGALSERELEVACGLACGHPVAEIAQELGVSASTVSTYRARAYEKLGVETNAQLVASLTRPSSQPDSEDAQKPKFRSRLLPGVALAAACVAGFLCGCYEGDGAFVAYNVALVAAGALLIAVGPNRIGEGGQSLGYSLAGVLVGLSMSAVLVLSPVAPGGFLGVALFAFVLAISVVASVWAAQEGLGSQQALGAGLGLLAMISVSYSGRYISPWMLLCFTLACIAAAAVLLWVGARGRRGKLVEKTLDGEVRARLYLEGRGLSSLEAGVALMAARGATAAETALALSMSPSSVAAYKSRGLKKLGVEGIDDLRELLKKDAGLALTVGLR